MHKQFVKRLLMQRGIVFLVALTFFIGTGSVYYQAASAANFTMRSGYYVGSGTAGKTISGLGFQPELVMIKSTTNAGAMVFKSSAMPANNTAFMGNTADNTATSLTMNSDGFVLGTLANLNSANVLYNWTAFAGSDCTSNGSFCVGTFTGNGNPTRAITTGFQPGLVIAKRSTAVGGHFRTASMSANRTEFFSTSAASTDGGYIASLNSDGFTVGATDNVNASTYYYIAFKADGNIFAEGTYVGDGIDSRNITGLSMQPDLVVIKNSTSLTTANRRSVMTHEYHHGDSASYIGDALASAPNFIQALQSNGFQVGSGVTTNELAATHYWFALGGTPGLPAASDTFSMDSGTYTGNGTAQSVTGLDFEPDLVIVKGGDTAFGTFAVYRTSMMAGDATAQFIQANDFAGGITTINADGFSVGTHATVNASGTIYHWQAFGNAYNPDTNSGAADFAVGAYYGNGVDNRNINSIPFQPDFVTTSRPATSLPVFRTSAQVGDLSGYYATTAEAANFIQSLNSTGFQVGTNAVANASGSVYRWFAFKEGSNFDVGGYTGNAVVDTAINTVGFSPDLVMLKRSTAVQGVLRPSTLAGDLTQYFENNTSSAGRIKSLTSLGFTVGNVTEVNASGGIYRYMAWRVPPGGPLSSDIVDAGGTTVASPSFAMNSIGYPFDCSQSVGILGVSGQQLRISNLSSDGAWSTSIAATDGATALWRNGGNTTQYDFNDPTGSPLGCSDGGDTDVKAGKLRVEPSGATLTPEPTCSASNISLGADQDFSEGSFDSVTLASASSLADTNCYWDLTDIDLRQYIPPQQPSENYNINLTITTVAA